MYLYRLLKQNKTLTGFSSGNGVFDLHDNSGKGDMKLKQFKVSTQLAARCLWSDRKESKMTSWSLVWE